MKFYYVLCHGGLWGNVPGFVLQGYEGKRDFRPEMTVEVRRAGRISIPVKGVLGKWPVKHQEEGRWALETLQLNCSTRRPWRTRQAPTPPSCPLLSPALSPDGQKRAVESVLDKQGPTCTRSSAGISASKLCALTLVEVSVGYRRENRHWAATALCFAKGTKLANQRLATHLTQDPGRLQMDLRGQTWVQAAILAQN